MSNQQQIKLTYFDFPGCAELTRLMLVYGGILFTDERIAREGFAKLKPTLPFGQLPVLQVDGKIFSQSMGIARYAAQLAGLCPMEPVEALQVDMVVDSICELIINPEVEISHEEDEAIKGEKIKQFLESTLPKGLKALEEMVQGDFFLDADKVSLADFVLFDFVVNDLQPGFPAFSLDMYPKLSAVVANVGAFPLIAAYVAK